MAMSWQQNVRIFFLKIVQRFEKKQFRQSEETLGIFGWHVAAL
jgi:hypothetical protein